MSNVYIKKSEDRRPHDPRTGLPRDLPGENDLNVPLPVRNTDAMRSVKHRVVQNEDGTESLVTEGGITLLTEYPARAWVKLKGEPAQLLVESPEEMTERLLSWRKDRGAMVVGHDFQSGYPQFYFDPDQIAYVGISRPTTQPQKIGARSIYSGTCECGRLGGPCPQPE